MANVRRMEDSMFRKLFCIFYTFVLLEQIQSQIIPKRERRQVSSDQTSFDSGSLISLDKIVPPNYNSLQPPPEINGKPPKVTMSVILMNIRGIDEEQEQIILEMNLRMSWEDHRLTFKPNLTDTDRFKVFSPELLNKIWHPDVFIDHSISVKMPAITIPPASLRIYDNNVVRYSARLTVTVACAMDFHLYPMDTQACPVSLMSYAYPASVMELDWADQHGDGASFAHPIILPNFQVELAPVKNLVTNTSSASYSNLEFEILLRRNIMYHLIQTYLPSFVFLMISWISFLIPKRSAPERITVCSLTMLSLVVMFGDLGIPKVSYMTALHIWMITVVLFVFASFVEFVLVLKFRGLAALAAKHATDHNGFNKKALRRKPKRSLKFGSKKTFELQQVQKGQQQDSVLPIGSMEVSSSSGKSMEINSHSHGHGENGHENHEETKYLNMSRNLDRLTSIILPTLFLIFCIGYWSWLLSSVRTGK